MSEPSDAEDHAVAMGEDASGPERSVTASLGLAAPSIWALKPWWCQPWSIVLTGVAVPATSWLLLQRLWITLPLLLAVLLWWWLFLVLVPSSYRRAVEADLRQS